MKKRMSRSFILLSLLITTISNENDHCSTLKTKLNKYGIQINHSREDFHGLRICEDFIDDICCPQIYEEDLQNATAMELSHLFQSYSMGFYQPLQRLIGQLNETINQLIENSRNETHVIFRNTFIRSYQPSIDLFYNQWKRINSRNYQHEIKYFVEEFFQNLLRFSLESSHSNDEQSSLRSAYLTCLWRHHPFGNRPNLLGKKLELHWKKFLHLTDLLRLTMELIQVMSTSVTSDYHCIDSYMQLSVCNLCSGRTQLPCQSNCIDVIESCLVNVTLINEIWMKFIDSLKNSSYFDGIEQIFSSIGTSLSDALLSLLNSNEMNHKDIIDQCGSIKIEKNGVIHPEDHSNRNSFSSSLIEQQLISMKQIFDNHRSFWLSLPKEICQSNEHSSSDNELCWTGYSISHDKRESMKIPYDKPLSLRLQWILKEMKEKSHLIIDEEKILIMTTTNHHLFNLTDHFNDYPTDDEFDYSDYGYEDLTERVISSTTIASIIDEMNTISYYDYGEQDVYTDDEWNETTTREIDHHPVNTYRIPLYHQRQPIIWNIQIDKEKSKSLNSSSPLSSWNCTYLFLFLFSLFLA